MWWVSRRLTGQTARDLEVRARYATSSRNYSVGCGHMLQFRQWTTLCTGPGALPEGALDRHLENVKLSKSTRVGLLAITSSGISRTLSCGLLPCNSANVSRVFGANVAPRATCPCCTRLHAARPRRFCSMRMSCSSLACGWFGTSCELANNSLQCPLPNLLARSANSCFPTLPQPWGLWNNMTVDKAEQLPNPLFCHCITCQFGSVPLP